MIGTILNVAGIVIGGLAGMTRQKPISPVNEQFFKLGLGVFTVFFGLRLTWLSLGGSPLQVLKQLMIVIVALGLGNLMGKLLRLQKTSNRIGQFARDRMASAKPGAPDQFSDGFSVCAALFCVAPLGILGAIHDGLGGYYYPLAVKAVMDGLATMGFISVFGRGIVLSAVPVLVFQGTVSLLCSRFVQPWLLNHGALLDSVNATGGLLIFCVALIIFEIKKVSIADYLPSLAVAPLLTWIFR